MERLLVTSLCAIVTWRMEESEVQRQTRGEVTRPTPTLALKSLKCKEGSGPENKIASFLI